MHLSPATLPNQKRGGRRAGAGRKPVGRKAKVSHRTRCAVAIRHPAHVTVTLRRKLPSLRQPREYAVIRRAFQRGKERFGFRLVHFAVLNDHLHFVVEAQGRKSLTRGIQGLLIRVAKALNKLWVRKGKVFSDRYHDRVLKSARSVRTALRYVLQNAKKHQAQGKRVRVHGPIDLYSSAPWFDGFVEKIEVRWLNAVPVPIARPRTWLLRCGWRWCGLIGVHEIPKVV